MSSKVAWASLRKRPLIADAFEPPRVRTGDVASPGLPAEAVISTTFRPPKPSTLPTRKDRVWMMMASDPSSRFSCARASAMVGARKVLSCIVAILAQTQNESTRRGVLPGLRAARARGDAPFLSALSCGCASGMHILCRAAQTPHVRSCASITRRPVRLSGRQRHSTVAPTPSIQLRSPAPPRCTRAPPP